MALVLDHLIDPRSGIRRAYRIRTIGQRFSCVDVEADGDDDAIRLSQPLGAFHAVELWDGARFIARFGPGETVSWGEREAATSPMVRPHRSIALS